MRDPLLRRRASPAAFAFALIMFAFPFVTVSCGGVPVVELSGFQLAFGTQFQGEPVGPYPMVVVALICVASGAVAGWLAHRRATVVIGSVGAGALLIFLLRFHLEVAQGSEGDGSIAVASHVSFWLAVAALVAGAVAAWSWLPYEARGSGGVGSVPESGAP
jgi:hypothetical protein